MIMGPSGSYNMDSKEHNEYKTYNENVQNKILKMFSKPKHHELPEDKITKKQLVLIFYLGGVSEAEISSIRYLNWVQDKFEY
eukprot:CAMPEP_0116943130 /NCGR_PEP_ID=MMETSP0467-20121206/35010_1 /TAXON_ID=283647 /ORGANISM="Mesodinium pulex, Strain SPMC105" /LENGTH=81 /DNA_ID=CAMNT_0004626265 /DNA_START=1505 /DNA_END=1750 /DNA_ORIENTATION=-